MASLVSSPSRKLRLRMSNEEGLALIRRFQWAVDVDCLVDGETLFPTEAMNIQVKATEAQPAPCLHITIAPPHPVLVDRLELLIVLKAFLDGVPHLRWSSQLTEDAHENGFYDADSTDLCSKFMDSSEGFHTAKALYSRGLPRRWLGVTLTANALGIERALDLYE
jgi:hypothetical protein